MASLSIIQMPSGKWRALVRQSGRKPSCKTHATKAQASQWGTKIKAAFEAGGEVEVSAVTVGSLLEAYRSLRDASRPIADSSTEHYTLKTLKRLLGAKDARRLNTEDLVAYCAERRDEGAGPYTLNMDISKLSTALRYAASAKNLLLPDSVGLARPLLKHLGLIGGGGKRERRPTGDELERVVKHLVDGRGLVYAEAVVFAVATAMRAGEICRVARVDIDREKRLVLVRDRKDPRKKNGNDQWVPLLPAAWAVVERQPAAADGRIFPIEAPTLSKYFTEAVRALGIPDLHLHDMRHEGTSRLFEEGYPLEQVALVTGHKDWRNLMRYTQLKPESLHR